MPKGNGHVSCAPIRPDAALVGHGTVHTGIEIAGTPARFAGTVRASFRRPAVSMGAPEGNAGKGVVGARRTSTEDNTACISRRMRCRIFGLMGGGGEGSKRLQLLF